MSNLFSLKSDDFLPHLANSFVHIRSNDLFSDVTLVSDDEQSFLSHKVIIASSSKYFFNRLRHHQTSHPVICLDGINSEELKYILDYLYYGEIKMDLKSIDRFIDIAKRFKLHGFCNEEENATISKNDKKVLNKEDITKHHSSENVKQSKPLNDEGSKIVSCIKDTLNVLNLKPHTKYDFSEVNDDDDNIPQHQHQTHDTDINTEEQDAGMETRTLSVSSRHTINNDELKFELEEIQFIRDDNKEPKVYACKNCDLDFESFYEAKWHYERHHQNLDKERTILMDLASYIKQFKRVDDATIKENFQTYTADVRNKMSILKDINFKKLNPTLRMKYDEIKQWLEMRVKFLQFKE